MRVVPPRRAEGNIVVSGSARTHARRTALTHARTHARTHPAHAPTHRSQRPHAPMTHTQIRTRTMTLACGSGILPTPACRLGQASKKSQHKTLSVRRARDWEAHGARKLARAGDGTAAGGIAHESAAGRRDIHSRHPREWSGSFTGNAGRCHSLWSMIWIQWLTTQAVTRSRAITLQNSALRHGASAARSRARGCGACRREKPPPRGPIRSIRFL